MNIIILAAGQGSRFLREEISTPKPLIKYMQKPLIWWAANSLTRVFKEANLYFVFRNNEIIEYSINEYLNKLFPSFKLISIPKLTSGPAETAHIASYEIIEKSEPSIFCDCDITFTLDKENLQEKINKSFNAICFTFNSTNPAYSYLEKDRYGNIKGAIEKKVISNSAISGAYLFKNINFYNKIYNQTFNNKYYKEKFMSNVLSKAISLDTKRFFECKLIDNLSLGTPKEILDAESSNRFPHWYLNERI